MQYPIANVLITEPQFVEIQNDGPTIKATDWWNLPPGEHMFYVSFTDGCIRLLVPPAWISALPRMKTGVERILVSLCTRPSDNHLAAEIIFDDGSDIPLTMLLCENQVESMIDSKPAPGRYRFDVYVDHDGPMRVLGSEATVHYVPRLPRWQPIKAKFSGRDQLN